MAERRRSLRRFYAALGVIAVVGIALIIWAARGSENARTAAGPAGAPLGIGAEPGAEGASGPQGARPSGHALGADDAPVEIMEFSDYQCPYCARFAAVTFTDVRERLIPTGRLRWRFMDFPLPSHPNSRAAHRAAACAGSQGRYWWMHDLLYVRQAEWAEERRPERLFRDYAGRVGLDPDRFRSCVEAGEPDAAIEANRAEGERLGVSGTPTFFVNGRMLPSTPVYDQLKALLDSLAPPAPPAAPAPSAPPAARGRTGSR